MTIPVSMKFYNDNEKMMRIFLHTFFLMFIIGCKDGIEIIGVDVDGIERTIQVKDKEFSKHLSKNLYQTYQWVEENPVHTKNKPIPWKPKAVIVGLGIEGRLSLFGNWQFRASPGIMVAILKQDQLDRKEQQTE